MPVPNYLPSNNYAGSSGYSVYGGSGQPTLATVPGYQDPLDYGVYDASSGMVKSIKTGKPWTGKEPRTGNTYTNGNPSTATSVQVPGTNTFINPNDPTQRYKPVDITKSPDIAAGQQDLLKTFTDSTAGILKDFNSYLNNFKTDLSSARTAATTANNIQPTVDALTKQQADYSKALSGDVTQLTDINAADATAQRGIVKQAQDLLPQYDTAVNNIGDYQQAAMANIVAKKHAGMGLSSDEEAQLAAGVAAVRLPLEQAKIGQAYSVLGQYALPVQRDIAGNQRSQATSFNPMVQGQQFTTARGVTMDIQSLKQQVANMSYQQAMQFMQAQGVPAQIQQSILSGQIGQLGQLSQLESMSHYQSLQDVLSPSLSQPANYSVGGTGPMSPNKVPNYGNPNGLPGSNQPVSVGPTGTATGTSGSSNPWDPNFAPGAPGFAFSIGAGGVQNLNAVPNYARGGATGQPVTVSNGDGTYTYYDSQGNAMAPTAAGGYTGDVNIPDYSGAYA